MGRIRKQIGSRIRVLREQRGLTQDELGALANMHRAYIGHIERGEKNITVDSLERIAEALKVSVKDLL